jgi:hypothetical protein
LVATSIAVYQCGSPIFFGSRPKTEIVHQIPAMVKTGLDPASIKLVQASVDTELLRKIFDRSGWWLLVLRQ